MSFLALCWKNLKRRRTRTLLTVGGVAVATVCLFSILSFDRGYSRALQREMERSGAHMYVSTEGCPLEAASLILHGGEIPKFLPEDNIAVVRKIEGVRAASGMLIFGVPNPGAQGRMDLFFGVTKDMLRLRPHWKIVGRFPKSDNEILLGAEVAKVEKRQPGEKIYFEGLDKEFVVAGVLERTGTQDDGFYFLDLKTAQKLFHKDGKLTAVATAVHQLSDIPKVESLVKERLPDAYVVTEKQMTTAIEGFVGGSKTLMASITVIALLVSLMGVLNTVLMSVFEMMREFGYMRCVGAARRHILRIVLTETLLVCGVGGVVGIVLGVLFSSGIDQFVRGLLPYAPAGKLVSSDAVVFVAVMVSTLVMGVVAGLYPAWLASRVSPMEAVRND